jgi:hypothetical protein
LLAAVGVVDVIVADEHAFAGVVSTVVEDRRVREADLALVVRADLVAVVRAVAVVVGEEVVAVATVAIVGCFPFVVVVGEEVAGLPVEEEALGQ